MKDYSLEILIERYINRVLEIQSKNQLLLEEDIVAIEKELQLTDSELILIENEFQKYLDRGIGFINIRNWSTAITELEKAVDLKPYHYKSYLLLASSFKQLYYQTNDIHHKKKAINFANRCLELDVKNADPYLIISDLQNTLDKVRIVRIGRGTLSKKLPKNRLQRNIIVCAGIVTMIFAVGEIKTTIVYGMFILIVVSFVLKVK